MYDFLEQVAGAGSTLPRDSFMGTCNAVSERNLAAYRFTGGKIGAITSEAEIRVMEEALDQTKSMRLEGAYLHLDTALDMLTDRY